MIWAVEVRVSDGEVIGSPMFFTANENVPPARTGAIWGKLPDSLIPDTVGTTNFRITGQFATFADSPVQNLDEITGLSGNAKNVELTDAELTTAFKQILHQAWMTYEHIVRPRLALVTNIDTFTTTDGSGTAPETLRGTDRFVYHQIALGDLIADGESLQSVPELIVPANQREAVINHIILWTSGYDPEQPNQRAAESFFRGIKDSAAANAWSDISTSGGSTIKSHLFKIENNNLEIISMPDNTSSPTDIGTAAIRIRFNPETQALG